MIKFKGDSEILLGISDGSWLSIIDTKPDDGPPRFIASIEDDDGEDDYEVLGLNVDDIPELICWLQRRLMAP